MSDHDHNGNAWKVSPTEYLRLRPSTHGIPEPSSCYVAMPDGCRLAVDVYLPADQGHGRVDDTVRFPTIAVFTPYYRRFKTIGPGADRAPNIAIFRDFFVPRGYALVTVDVRGCGASFGTRDSFRSPREREDYRNIADWIVAQPWSNGVIGSTGISYVGAAACFLASTGHPAVKAIAPLFAVSDTYSDHIFPGGIMCTTVTANYDHMVRALDQDLREELKPYSYFNAPNYAGPQPVDDDPDGFQLRMAIEEHRGSFKLRDMAGELAFREEPTPHDPDLHLGACSPYWYLSEVAGKVAIYSVSGWYDGSAFANASISRWLSNRGANDRLLLGPWDHGARTNGSPWRGDSAAPEFPLLAEVLRFFDEHLAGLDTGISAEDPIHYHTVREEKWQSAAQWPPHAAATRYSLCPGGQLSPRGPQTETHAAYQTQFTTGTGKTSRFERLMSVAVTDYYSDWNGREARMLSFTSAAFDTPAELTGHAVVRLHVSTSERDGSVFVYLSEVDAEGRSWYITEGALRMLHRATSACPPTYRTTWPFRTFHRDAARRMTPGKAEPLHFALLPVSWRLAAGSRLRLSIAGTDADHFAQVPHGRPPRFEFTLGGDNGSSIELPFVRPVGEH